MADRSEAQYEPETRTEMLDGQIVRRFPCPLVDHSRTAGNLFCAFRSRLNGKPCEIFGGSDVYLSPRDCVAPDAMIVCKKDIVRRAGIYGAPDLIVEVLSPGTEKRDRGYKKELYETSGVREYWIVNPEAKSVEVYLLTGGKYVLDEVYRIFPDYVEFRPGEREAYRNEVRVSLFDGFAIPLEEIFYNVL